MTDRLHDLLRDEADRLAVPPAPGGAVVARGRGLRRRRRLAEGVAVVVVLVVATGGALALTGGDDTRRARAVDPVAPPVVVAGAAFSIGNTVFVDDGDTSAVLDGALPVSLDQTSAGLLVSHVRGADQIGRGEQRFSLVRPDGTVGDVDVAIDEPGPTGEREETPYDTDPTQPYLAYTETTGGVVHVVVHDVDTDRQVADVPVPDAQVGVLQQVAIDGDRVYVGGGQVVQVVDWRTGAVAVSTTLSGVLESAAGGHAMMIDRSGATSVVDAATGAVLVPAPPASDDVQFSFLSPDGAHAIYSTAAEGESSFEVYDVATGGHVTVAGSGRAQGWTADGRLFTISDADVLTTCSPDAGRCTTTTLDLPVHPGDAVDQSDALRVVGAIR